MSLIGLALAMRGGDPIDPAVRGLPDFLNEGTVLGRDDGDVDQGRRMSQTVALHVSLPPKEVERRLDEFTRGDRTWSKVTLHQESVCFDRAGSVFDHTAVRIYRGKRALGDTRFANVTTEIVDPKGTTIWIQQGERKPSWIERIRSMF